MALGASIAIFSIRTVEQDLKRPAYPMPSYVAEALQSEGLQGLYDQRPWYQRNDYLSWIDRAKREDTKLKRLRQMLDELKAGDVYMKMEWQAKR